MRDWLGPLTKILERGEAAMLVHLVELKGSGPREVGAQMLVTEDAIHGTIGGGELEHAATLQGRALLQSGRAGLQRYALGPELNQCCGGSVTLAFEPFAPADRAWLRKLSAAAEDPVPIVRSLRLDTAGALRRDWTQDDLQPDYAVRMNDGVVEISERVNSAVQALWLFGAGHVGTAMAHALRPLGFAITWIDGRAGQFPVPPLPDVRQLELAMPELAVDEAPRDTIFLIMTHSHQLDEQICEAVLRRDDFAYLGLIGSATKRALFVKRLAEAGIGQPQLQRLVCPIGLPQIESKEPAAIAASVAADLLMRRERQLLRATPAVLNGRR